MSELKDLVKDQQVHFEFYRQKELWYKTDSGFEFPVPIDDAGDGVFLKTDKAILFMRYIRKHLESIEKGKQEVQQMVASTQGFHFGEDLETLQDRTTPSLEEDIERFKPQ